MFEASSLFNMEAEDMVNLLEQDFNEYKASTK
jgi:hypothetical protein